MPSYVERLNVKGLIKPAPPEWLPDNVQYETTMGSVAYGVSTDDSDFDISGFCIPPKHEIFPHLAGEIPGFDEKKRKPGVWQQHHIYDPDALRGRGREYDISISHITHYFQLCMDNNPDKIDSLFTPIDCVLHITPIGHMVRDNRKLFLHKGAYHRFSGYAYSQLAAMDGKNRTEGSKRAALIEEFGFDVKFAYHTIRLLQECEQILEEGDIDLRRNNEVLKAIRRGDVSQEEVKKMAASMDAGLKLSYNNSKLQYGPDKAAIKKLLLNCLEEHYGDLSSAVVKTDKATEALLEINKIVQKAMS